jgi:hypothetical protein
MAQPAPHVSGKVLFVRQYRGAAETCVWRIANSWKISNSPRTRRGAYPLRRFIAHGTQAESRPRFLKTELPIGVPISGV